MTATKQADVVVVGAGLAGPIMLAGDRYTAVEQLATGTTDFEVDVDTERRK